VYAINAGYCWGNQTIGQETVRFSFHDSHFLIDHSDVRVLIQNQSSCNYGIDNDELSFSEGYPQSALTPIQYDVNGTPYIEFTYENIMDSIQIHMMNQNILNYFSPFYELFFIGIIIAFSLILPFILIKTRRYALTLALIQLGLFGSFIYFSSFISYSFFNPIIFDGSLLFYVLVTIALFLTVFVFRKEKSFVLSKSGNSNTWNFSIDDSGGLLLVSFLVIIIGTILFIFLNVIGFYLMYVLLANLPLIWLRWYYLKNEKKK
jgi:hypothetical protein